MTNKPKVTIIIPVHNALQLTKLCLNLLRKHTSLEIAKIIVVDNYSQNESKKYLRKLPWITLIERTPSPNETPVSAHSEALDLALKQITTPYVLSIHNDTFVKNPKWLDFLLTQIENKKNVAAVGSWKLENKSWLECLLKKAEDKIKLKWYQLLGKDSHRIAGAGSNHYYLRSHCALYRMDLIKQYGLTFTGDEETAGKTMHRILAEAGYQLTFLPSEVLNKYIDHVNHATTLLETENIKLNRTLRQTKKRLAKAFAEFKKDLE